MNKTFVKQVLKDFIDLGEVEIKTGPFGTQLHASDYVEKGTSVINVRNIGYGRIKTDKLEYINEKTVQRLSSHLLKHNDIVFGRKGAVDRHALIGPNQQGWFQGSDCLRIRIKSESVDPRYLSYCFLTDNHKKWMMAQCSHGATMASLNQDIISRIQVCLPNIQIQQKIASILSAYDDLIENNNMRIEILEQMAKLVYEEWFVKFRFQGHENVKMVPSDLGEIPEGWKVCSIKEITTLIKRGIAPKYDESSNNIVINQKCIRDFRLSLEESRKHISKVPPEKSLVKGDVLINSTGVGTLGRTTQVLEYLPNCTVDSHVTIVRPDKNMNCNFFGLQLFRLQNYFESQGRGATGQAELGRDTIEETKFIVPPKELQDDFSNLVDPLRNLALKLSKKNQNFRKTRDLLLPKLISGEIDVSDLDIRIRNEFQK